MKCVYHLCKNKLSGQQTMYCSNACKTKSQIKKWRHRIKEKAIAYKGGKCQQCGYDRCASALEFHHRDPDQKDFGISTTGNCMAWHKVKIELDKCDMLCANCHREIHSKLADGARIERAV